MVKPSEGKLVAPANRQGNPRGHRRDNLHQRCRGFTWLRYRIHRDDILVARPNSVNTAPPAPGMINAYLQPKDYYHQHLLVRVETQKWLLCDRQRIIATVGTKAQIMAALEHMPVCERLTPLLNKQTVGDELLADIMKGLL